MSNDVVPRPDGAFDDFQKHFIDTAAAAPGQYGLTPQDITELQAAQNGWAKAYPAHQSAQLTAVAARQAKDESREALEAALRSSIRKVNAGTTVSNALRAALGLPPHEESRSPNQAPATHPLGRIEHRGALRQEIHWTDADTPRSRRKPAGVIGCELWLKVGDGAPSNEEGCTLVALDTASPYLCEHEAADAGKTAHWLLRWVSTRGEKGPFGPVVSAKING